MLQDWGKCDFLLENFIYDRAMGIILPVSVPGSIYGRIQGLKMRHSNMFN